MFHPMHYPYYPHQYYDPNQPYPIMHQQAMHPQPHSSPVPTQQTQAVNHVQPQSQTHHHHKGHKRSTPPNRKSPTAKQIESEPKAAEQKPAKEEDEMEQDVPQEERPAEPEAKAEPVMEEVEETPTDQQPVIDETQTGELQPVCKPWSQNFSPMTKNKNKNNREKTNTF